VPVVKLLWLLAVAAAFLQQVQQLKLAHSLGTLPAPT
jgi:hypothetical protein